MYGQVYKVTNNLDSKAYIGQTIRSLEDRFNSHVKEAKNSHDHYSRFHNAIRKYGHANFTITMIGQALDKKSLDILERYYVAFYRKLLGSDMVYNVSDGGDGGYNPGSGSTNHKKNCDCSWCKAKRGKMFGKHNPMFGKSQSKDSLTKAVKTRMKNGSYSNVWNKNLTKETDKRVAINAKRGAITIKNQYRLEGRKAWNIGLTKETDVRVRKYGELQHRNSLLRKEV